MSLCVNVAIMSFLRCFFLVSTVCVQAVNVNDVCKHTRGTAADRELGYAGWSFCLVRSTLERRMCTQPLALERGRAESGPARAEDGGGC